MLNMALKCQFHPLKFSKNKNLIERFLIKNLTNLKRKNLIKNFDPKNLLITNKMKNIKKEVRCFKCDQKGHIAPNCKNKINVLSEKRKNTILRIILHLLKLINLKLVRPEIFQFLE